jgi:hypothetical protein
LPDVFEERGWAITYADVAATLGVLLAAAALVLLLVPGLRPGGGSAAPGAVTVQPSTAGGKVKGAGRISFLATEPVKGKPVVKIGNSKLFASCYMDKQKGGTWIVNLAVAAVTDVSSTNNAFFITDDSNSETPHVRGAALGAGQPFELFQGDGPPFVEATAPGTGVQAEGQLVIEAGKETVTMNYHAFASSKPDGGACELTGTAISAK